MPSLDFNVLEETTLKITMKDPDKTVIRVSTPTEGLLERLQSAAAEMRDITSKKDPHRIHHLYALIAEVISRNDDYITVTGEELEHKYMLSLADLVIFMARYLRFIREISNAKN